MTILALETSGTAGSIALVSDGGLVGECELPATGRRHARLLVPEIKRLLHNHQLPLAQLNAVAVSAGPGSFTGLRVGVVCAKTLAYALGCPLVAVDTFLAVAAALPAEVGRVWVIDDALRGEVFAQMFVRHSFQHMGGRTNNSQEWRSAGPGQIIPLQSWLSTLSPEDLVTGPGLAVHQAAIAQVGIPRTSPELWLPQARWIAELAGQDLLQHRTTNPWELEPFYIRRSAAEEKAAAKASS